MFYALLWGFVVLHGLVKVCIYGFMHVHLVFSEAVSLASAWASARGLRRCRIRLNGLFFFLALVGFFFYALSPSGWRVPLG